MPKPLREPAELGCIGRRGGQCRAEFRAWDAGRELRFEGPYRDSEEFAQDDLLTIRAAGERMTRTEALQAMEAQSIFLKNEAKGESGFVDRKENQYRASVDYRDDDGHLKHIRGPVRHNERRPRARHQVCPRREY